MCCISEPWKIPAGPLWFACGKNNLAAIHRSPEKLREICALALSAQNFVAIRCKDLYIVSIYMSPNARIDRFLAMLHNLRNFITSVQGKIIMCGDLNARSRLWSDITTNHREKILETWVAELDLRLGNVGSVPTCVRPQGASVNDLTVA